MKKLFLVVTVLFISVSASFAFQQTIYAGPPVHYNGMGININATCSYVKLDCSWGSFLSADAHGSAVAYGDLLIGEYFFSYGNNHPNYSNGIFSSRYWDFVQVYLVADNCYGEATLEWGY